MFMDKAYQADKYEDKIYQQWEQSGAFAPSSFQEGEKPFSIAMPPPNVTGTLHLGHAVMLVLEDLMTRYRRMLGQPVLWLPGTDHAAIATQSVVEKQLQKSGIKNPRQELGREKLLEQIRAFVDASKDTIRSQIKKMGSSCDWSREKYTLEDQLNHAVNTFFGRMYADGLIYHGDRMVNWDPKMKTTVADDELEYREEKTKFYYFQYGPVVIATARPETKFADKVIVVHPDDERYQDLHGKEFEVEWINGPIKARVLADPCIDLALGTGAMTITPAHAHVDFDLAQKYELDRPQIIDFDGRLTAVAGEFVGMPITEAREKIVHKLAKKGLLVKVDENYSHSVAVNYRGKGLIEPQIMKQWFIDVSKQAIAWKGERRSLKEIMQDVVRAGMIEIIPQRFAKLYFHWIDNLRDWCISRQIWWGHQLPVWFRVSAADKRRWQEHPDAASYLLPSLGIEILETKFSETEPAGDDWIRDPDTLDTWFSSALWTFSTLGWPEQTQDFQRFHPTSVMETGYDILFFWVARMILASTYCLRADGLAEEQSIPFQKVYLHGLIRTREGKKMSKSDPETCIDPLDMITKYGTDALRLALVVGSTPGNDMSVYEEKIAGYRNFANKLWNAARFVLTAALGERQEETLADKWLSSRLANIVARTTENLEKYHLGLAGEEIYRFLWGDFCDWYLEAAKIEGAPQPLLRHALVTILKLVHPYAPFVTEAIWQEAKLGEGMLMTAAWPEAGEFKEDKQAETDFGLIMAVVTTVRRLRSDSGIEPGAELALKLWGEQKFQSLVAEQEALVKRLARLTSISFLASKAGLTRGAVLDNGAILQLDISVADLEKIKARAQQELNNVNKFITQIEGKLANRSFISNAPAEIVTKEQQKLATAKERQSQLESQLKA